jgi:hypothetical protein
MVQWNIHLKHKSVILFWWLDSYTVYSLHADFYTAKNIINIET